MVTAGTPCSRCVEGRYGYITAESESRFTLTFVSFPVTPDSSNPAPAGKVVEEEEVSRQVYESHLVTVRLLEEHRGRWTLRSRSLLKRACTLAILLPTLAAEHAHLEDLVCVYHGRDGYPYCKGRNSSFTG